jgi:peroxiredoxin
MFRTVVLPAVIALALLFGCTDKSEQANASSADFTLQDMNGNKVKLSDYRGRVVLLEFWATWCPPCRASIPGLEKIHKAYKEKGLVVLAVSMDEGDWPSVKSFMKDYGITYTVLKGTDEVASQYHVRTIPMLLILDKEGRISKRYMGFGMEEDLEKDIKAVL